MLIYFTFLSEYDPPMEKAIARRNIREIRRVLRGDQVSDLSRRRSEDDPPYLHLAIDYGCSIEILKLLCQHYPDVNLKDKKGLRPIEVAAANGRQDVMEWLITEKHAETNQEIIDRCLKMAAKYHQLHLIPWLIEEKGANIYWYYSTGRPVESILSLVVTNSILPLHIPKKSRENITEDHPYYRIMEYLLEKGVDPNFGFNPHLLPLNKATDRQEFIIIRLLIRYGAKVVDTRHPAIFIAVYSLNMDITRFYLRHHPQLIDAVHRKNTLLHEACRGYVSDRKLKEVKFNMIELMVRCGIDVNAQDSSGNTALHLMANALEFRRLASIVIRTIILLFSAGIKINIQNEKKETALLASTREPWDLIKEKERPIYCIPPTLLFMLGADPNIADGHGKKPIDYTVSHIDRMCHLFYTDRKRYDEALERGGFYDKYCGATYLKQAREEIVKTICSYRLKMGQKYKAPESEKDNIVYRLRSRSLGL